MMYIVYVTHSTMPLSVGPCALHPTYTDRVFNINILLYLVMYIGNYSYSRDIMVVLVHTLLYYNYKLQLQACSPYITMVP